MTTKPYPKVGVQVLVIRDGQLLMTKRKSAHGDGTRGTVGGKLEFGETREACAVREAYEEVGIHITTMQLVAVNNIIAYEKHYVDIAYVAQAWEGEPSLCEPDVHEYVERFPIDDLPTNIFTPVQAALKSYLAGELHVC